MAAFTHNLNVIARCTQMQRGQRLKALGICGGQVPYLLRLCRLPGQTQEELAQALYVNKSTAARQITSLERAGFVERRPSTQDRRCLCVYPTERALEALPMLHEVVQEWSDYLLDGLDGSEREMLMALMERISERAQTYIQREVGWDI